MAGQTEIANRALQLIGDMVITDIDDADSNAARHMKAAWNTCRRAVLRGHPWNFALARASLPVDATAPTFGWLYAYTQPTEPYCLRVLRAGMAYDDGPGVAFKIEGRKILCDATAPLPVQFIADITDPEQFDAEFVEVLALKLAVATGPALGAPRTLIADLKRELPVALRDAKSSDAQEGTPDRFFADDFVNSRL